mgnify:CR=1 FL=1
MLHMAGKCGLYCGACSIYIAQRDSAKLRAQIASDFNCGEDQVRCNGCGDLTSECWGNGCAIVLCTRAREVDYCFECPDYENKTCEKFAKLANNYLENGVDLADNLKQIKAGKVEDWLQQCKERFSCQACGKPFTVHEVACWHCGNKTR